MKFDTLLLSCIRETAVAELAVGGVVQYNLEKVAVLVNVLSLFLFLNSYQVKFNVFSLSVSYNSIY